MITQIKDKLKKIKPAFSFFRFYYYAVKKSPKQYDELRKYHNNFFILMTPIILMLIYLFVSLFLPVGAVLFGFLWIPIIILNLLFTHNVNIKGREIESKLREKREEIKREEIKREERERKRKEEAEMLNKWFEEFIKQERFKAEDKKRKEREGFERKYRDYYGYSGNHNHNHNHNHNQKKQKTYTHVDQNRINAMKLLSLKDGFTLKDLKSAYKRLSKIHHPDAPKGSETNFIKLNKAYNYLLERM